MSTYIVKSRSDYYNIIRKIQLRSPKNVGQKIRIILQGADNDSITDIALEYNQFMEANPELCSSVSLHIDIAIQNPDDFRDKFALSYCEATHADQWILRTEYQNVRFRFRIYLSDSENETVNYTSVTEHNQKIDNYYYNLAWWKRYCNIWTNIEGHFFFYVRNIKIVNTVKNFLLLHL